MSKKTKVRKQTRIALKNIHAAAYRLGQARNNRKNTNIPYCRLEDEVKKLSGFVIARFKSPLRKIAMAVFIGCSNKEFRREYLREIKNLAWHYYVKEVIECGVAA